MIPVVQSIVRGEGEPGVPGDCLRACVASIFELPLEDVPHFVADPRTWLPALADWLSPMGLGIDYEEYGGAWEKAPRRLHEGHWIAGVSSQRFPGGRHAVVMDFDRIAWDPSPTPRTVPYLFDAEKFFVVIDPVRIHRAMSQRMTL